MTDTVTLEDTNPKNSNRGRRNYLVDPLVGYRIRLLRTSRNVSPKTVGRALGVAVKKLNDIESGMAELTAGQLYSLAMLFSIDVNYFYQDFAELEKVAGVRDTTTNLAKELSEICKAYLCLEDKKLRKSLIDLVKSMDPAKAQN